MTQFVLHGLQQEMQSLSLLLLLGSGVLHFIFASGVARDVGRRQKVHQDIFLVSGYTWIFATLLGGILVVAVYWLIHYSKLR